MPSYPPTGPGIAPPWPYPTGFGFVPYVPAGPAPGVGWAGIGVRFAALLIDIVLMIVTYFGVVLVVENAGLGRYVRGSYVYSQTATALVLVWFAFAIAYHPFCWYFSGRSLGQRALGLRVVRASDGLKLGLGAILIRYIIFIVTTGTVLLGIIAAGMAARDPFKRAWHDKVARSVVVKWP
jgi:uncharacterized RDD family membrane protein YckC